MQQAKNLPEEQLALVSRDENKKNAQWNETVGMIDSKREKSGNEVVFL